ncbi:MAG: hypothetical protein JWM53_3202 [bacterium]|nr:hypothetical protein [bacterium]
MRIQGWIFAAALASGCHQSLDDRPCASWTQWAHDAAHGGSTCAGGDSPGKLIATVKIDPFVFQENPPQTGNGLQVHYQAPLVVGEDVYVMSKGGTFTDPCPTPDGGTNAPCYAWDSQVWSESRYAWSNGELRLQWTVPSDWKPVPSDLTATEPMFQPAISGDLLYVPAGQGTLSKIDRHSGAVLGSVGLPADPDLYVSGPLVADSAGNIYYNAIKLDHDAPATRDAKGWLVRVSPSDESTSASYDDLVPSAPTGAACHGTFANMQPPPPLPWPPPDNADGTPARPPAIECGSQRPGINVAPAIGSDGTLFTVSRAHHSDRDGFVLAVDSDLHPKWAASLGGILSDGCGVNVEAIGDPTADPYQQCSSQARHGVDPATNDLPIGRILDDSSSSPVALPDGGVLYGAFALYDGARGHLFKLAADGTPAGTYDFGWDYTPAIWQHGTTYSVVIKDNRYDERHYYITQLDANLGVEWRFDDPTTELCQLLRDTLTCAPVPPDTFEWCINAPAVDKDGTIYAGDEGGFVYAIGQGGHDKGHRFLSMALGASYTPLTIDRQGRLYTLDAGMLGVVGR